MKDEIRNYFKQLRKNADKDELFRLSSLAQDMLLKWDVFCQAEKVMLYSPIANEVDTSAIIKKASESGKTVILPATDEDTLIITPYLYKGDDNLKKGGFSISEPQNSTIFDKNEIELILIPGVAFSPRGGRIGFGKGCYDRFLEGTNAKKVGFCYEFQLTNRIKSESHDIELDYIVTEDRIIDCNQQKNMMVANYHTHTYLCHHAEENPHEYVEEAIRNGIEILGFSDHAPCPFSTGHKSGFRIDLEDAKKYFDTINELKEKYKYYIEIHVGCEMEYYPAEYENTIKLLQELGCEYLILGQHFLNNEYDGICSYNISTPEAMKDYVSQVSQGIKTGKYTYIAHPDFGQYREDNEFYTNEVTKLLTLAKEMGIPVEFNLLGFEEKRHYPYDIFWELVAKVGTDVIVGCDAHKAVSCGNPIIYKEAIKKLETFGITPIKTVKLREV